MANRTTFPVRFTSLPDSATPSRSTQLRTASGSCGTRGYKQRFSYKYCRTRGRGHLFVVFCGGGKNRRQWHWRRRR